MAPDMTRLQMDRAKISLERLIRSRAIPVQIAQIVVYFGPRLIPRPSPQIHDLRSAEIALPPPQDTQSSPGIGRLGMAGDGLLQLLNPFIKILVLFFQFLIPFLFKDFS